ncbi:MAG: hypothetical protein ACI9QL_002982 [Candidatus Omnitrophota bacterium]|jgi:hypothetical protein
MCEKFIRMTTVLGITLSLTSLSATARHVESWVYQVKITNITKGTDLSQGLVLTPILLVAHSSGTHLFELGEPASKELAMLAEGGDTAPMTALMEETPGVQHIETTGGPLLPGASVEVDIPYTGRRTVLSTASMLLPTNDGFVSLDGVKLPFYQRQSTTYYASVYDAGSEINDELCASIPGPHCAGEGFAEADGEGKVHVHSGLHGVGDLAPAAYDWNNPVIKVTIQLIRK